MSKLYDELASLDRRLAELEDRRTEVVALISNGSVEPRKPQEPCAPLSNVIAFPLCQPLCQDVFEVPMISVYEGTHGPW